MQRTFTAGLSVSALAVVAIAAEPDPLPADATYRPLPTMPFSQVKEMDEAQKPQVMARQRELLEARYDLSNQAMDGVMMSGGLKPVQEGVRGRLAQGQSWDSLANLTAQEIRENKTHSRSRSSSWSCARRGLNTWVRSGWPSSRLMAT